MNDFADQFRAVLDANPRLTIQGYGISNLYKGDDREGEFKRAREELELHVNLDAIAKAVAWLNTKGRRKTVNTRAGSTYGIKHVFEADSAKGGCYITNGEFIAAALIAGFEVPDGGELNPFINVSSKGLSE